MKDAMEDATGGTPGGTPGGFMDGSCTIGCVRAGSDGESQVPIRFRW